jgi:carbonic anhydrase
MKTHTAETQATMTPRKAMNFLKEGNDRFVNNLKANRNLMDQVDKTRQGQFPFATILHCIDSRVSAELLFDQGIGDIFSIRIAGNFVNEDILGSMEFASKLAGTKLILVMGHTHCGAIKGACDHARMGNLTALINKLEPVVDVVEKDFETKGSGNPELVQKVAEENVHYTIRQILERSPILKEMVDAGDLGLVGSMYDIETGKVEFYESDTFVDGKKA